MRLCFSHSGRGGKVFGGKAKPTTGPNAKTNMFCIACLYYTYKVVCLENALDDRAEDFTLAYALAAHADACWPNCV